MMLVSTPYEGVSGSQWGLNPLYIKLYLFIIIPVHYQKNLLTGHKVGQESTNSQHYIY